MSRSNDEEQEQEEEEEEEKKESTKCSVNTEYLFFVSYCTKNVSFHILLVSLLLLLLLFLNLKRMFHIQFCFIY